MHVHNPDVGSDVAALTERMQRARGRRFPVILVDANLLIYAHVASFPQHAGARAWLDGRINAAAPVGERQDR